MRFGRSEDGGSDLLPCGVIGNTSDSESEESRFDPWRGNSHDFREYFDRRRVRLVVRTPPSHGGNTSSNLVRGTRLLTRGRQKNGPIGGCSDRALLFSGSDEQAAVYHSIPERMIP